MFNYEESIKRINDKFEAKAKELAEWRDWYTRVLAKINELLPELKKALGKLHLNLDELNYFKTWIGDNEFGLEANTKLVIKLTARSDGKFKFITFRGYDSRGRGKNSDALYRKATKIKEAIEAIGVHASVNPYSLEVRDGALDKGILIDLWI